MQNGENAQALHKHLDLIRYASILLLLIHFYAVCFPAMTGWGLTSPIVTRLLYSLSKGLFFLSGVEIPKLVILGLLGLSLFGHQGKKSNKLQIKRVLTILGAGLVLYFLSSWLLCTTWLESTKALLYMTVTSIGYLLIMNGGAKVSRLLSSRLGKDIFNIEAETFPQEQRLLENEFSINLPAQYRYKGKFHPSFINIISPTRGLLVLGVPGSG